MSGWFRRTAMGRQFARPWLGPVAVAAVAVLVAVAPGAAAAAPDGGPGGFAPPLLGLKYWDNFVDFWSDAIRKQSGVVLVAIGVGLVSLFIITRSKKR